MCILEDTFLLYQSLNMLSEKVVDQLNCSQYIGVSHLSGMTVSFLNISWSEIGKPYYLHVNTCHNVKKSVGTQASMKNFALSD